MAALAELLGGDANVAALLARHQEHYAASRDAEASTYLAASYEALTACNAAFAHLDLLLRNAHPAVDGGDGMPRRYHHGLGGLADFLTAVSRATTLITYKRFFDGLVAAAGRVCAAVRAQPATAWRVLVLRDTDLADTETQLALVASWEALAPCIDEVLVLRLHRAGFIKDRSVRVNTLPPAPAAAAAAAAPPLERQYVLVPFEPMLSTARTYLYTKSETRVATVHATVAKLGYTPVLASFPVSGIWTQRAYTFHWGTPEHIDPSLHAYHINYEPGRTLVVAATLAQHLAAALKIPVKTAENRIYELLNENRDGPPLDPEFRQFFLGNFKLPFCLDLDWWLPQDLHKNVCLWPCAQFAPHALQPHRAPRTGVPHPMLSPKSAPKYRPKKRTPRPPREAIVAEEVAPPAAKRARMDALAAAADDDDAKWNEAQRLMARLHL